MTTTDHLTTGWEPDLDPADTMVRRYLGAWIAQCEAFVASVGGATTRTERWVLSDAGRPTGLFDAATLLAPLPVADPWAAVEEIERASSTGTGELHLWSAWPTPDLRRRGWELVGHPPLLIRPPARQVPAPVPRSAVPVVPVVDAHDLSEWERVVVDGYPFPELQPYRPRTMVGPELLADDRFRLLVGCEHGEAVSASALMVHDGLGVFAVVVTVPGARGRGHWRAHAIDRLAAAPDLWMAGVFSDDSRPLAEAAGFVPILRSTLWALPRR